MLKLIISRVLKLFRIIVSLYLACLLVNYLFSVSFGDFKSLLRIIFNKREITENPYSIKYFQSILSDGWKLAKVNYIWGKINLSYFGKYILSKTEAVIITKYWEGTIFVLSLLSLSFLLIFITVYFLLPLLFYLIVI